MRLKQTERGVSFLELMIVLPFLVLMILGIVEYGMAIRQMEQLTNSARHAARYAAAKAGETTVNCSDPLVAGQSCGDILGGWTPASPSIEFFAKYTACNALDKAGSTDPDSWNVQVQVNEPAGPPLLNSVARPSGKIVRVDIAYSASATFCILCVGDLRALDLVGMRPGLDGGGVKSSSAFALEGNCS